MAPRREERGARMRLLSGPRAVLSTILQQAQAPQGRFGVRQKGHLRTLSRRMGADGAETVAGPRSNLPRRNTSPRHASDRQVRDYLPDGNRCRAAVSDMPAV